jgi:hypothetical protein
MRRLLVSMVWIDWSVKLVVLLLLGMFVGSFFQRRPVIHAGDQCGPEHHWGYETVNASDTELTCRPD